MPFHVIYEVDVPIHRSDDPDQRGLHVFTGEADSPTTALQFAHAAYDAALTGHTSPVPNGEPSGWRVRGARPGWDLEWDAATVTPWHNPHGWMTRSPIPL
ncbi:hypothetical protein ABT160_24295 [Streptomyces sp. NPDC001941]|uniref:hypothetical protein n=1 Tax=Streptomyces sp. NPDC001941 TaxID=3154659 RepID=UPI003332D72C